jgi:ABC-type glycerol-3-phosphate transport system substrate-binding protein
MASSLKKIIPILGSLALISSHSICYGATLKLMAIGTIEENITKLQAIYEKNQGKTKIKTIFVESQSQFTDAFKQNPDVFIGSPNFIVNWADLSYFTDLSQILSKNVVKNLLPGIYESFSVKGHQVAVPLMSNLNQLEYNKTLFSKEGLQFPDSTWTWECKFLESCKKLSKDIDGDGMNDQFGIVGFPIASSNYLTILHSYGGSLTDKALKKVTYTEKPAMTAIDYIIKLHQSHLAEIFDFSMIGPNNLPFINGKSGMQISNSSIQSVAKANNETTQSLTDFASDVTSVPAGPKGCMPVANPTIAGIFKNTKNLKDSLAFINYLTSTEGQSTLYDICYELPTTYSGLKYKRIGNTVSAQILKGYMTSQSRAFSKNVSQLERNFWDDIFNMINGKLSTSGFITNARNRERELLR